MDLKYINRLSSRIGFEWHSLGIHLGFLTPQLEHLKYAYPHDIQQCISSMLTEWFNVVTQEIPDPSMILSEALKNADRTDIAMEINEEFNKGNKRNKSYTKDKISRVEQLLKEVKFSRKSNNFDTFYDQTKCYLENFKKDKQMYVQTRAADKAVEELKMTKFFTVIGNAGDGKTTLVMNLLVKVSDVGYHPIILSDPSLIEQIFDPDRKIVYFVDDAFGTPALNPNLVDVWSRLHGKLNALISNGNCHLVLASRKQTYTKAYPKIRDFRCYVDNLIDLTTSYALTSREKKEIIFCHSPVNSSNRPFSQRVLPPMSYLPGFPLLCSLYATLGNSDTLSEFFEKPTAFLQRQITMLRETDPEAYFCLVVVMLYDGKLPDDIFDPFNIEDKDKTKIKAIKQACGVDKHKTINEIESNFDSLVGVYFEKQDMYFKFAHDCMMDAMCLDFGRKYPKQILEVATSDFITSRVRTENTFSDLSLKERSRFTYRRSLSTPEIPEVVLIDERHYECLVQRWIKDIKNGKIENVLNNPCSRNENILKFIVDNISRLPKEEIGNIFQATDNVSSASLLEMICKRGIKDLVGKLFRAGFGECVTTENLSLAFMEAVLNGHVEIVRLLLEYNPEVQQTCMVDEEDRQAVHFVSEKGDIKMLKVLINKGGNVSADDICKIQPIHLASRNKSSACLSLLIENGAPVNANDQSNLEPLHYACENGSVECVKLLLDKGADINSKTSRGKVPIHYAAACDESFVLAYLVSQKADIQAVDNLKKSALHFAATAGKHENVESLIIAGCDPNIKERYGRTPLHIACSTSCKNPQDSTRCIEALLKYGAHVNALDDRQKTPLHYACAWSYDHRYHCAQLLIENGANTTLSDSSGMQPLMCAFKSKSIKCAKLLIDKGGDLNTVGLHPVHNACIHGDVEMLSALNERGFKLSSKDSVGKCPIHYACQYGREKCLDFLLTHGVDVNTCDVQGMTPLHYACKWDKAHCRNQLLLKGADISLKNIDGKKPADMIPPWTPLKFSKSFRPRTNSL